MCWKSWGVQTLLHLTWGILFVCCCFMSQQQLRSHKDGYWLVKVRTHGDFYSAVPLGDQATSTMTWYPTQSQYPDTESTSPCPIRIIPNTWLGSDKYQFYKSLVWLNWSSNPRSPTCEAHALPIGPPSPVPEAYRAFHQIGGACWQQSESRLWTTTEASGSLRQWLRWRLDWHDPSF